ncbi:CU044_2847 family protein [Streptomyces sp. NPDC058665]|uniref:CU044_2847 family protein n=1 Tax=Streptomyces sp. NPDC058665 TaxID=3346586 RepID=UPI00365F5EC4
MDRDIRGGHEVREVVLPGGEVILARVGVLREDNSGFDDVGAADRLRAGVTRVNEVIAAVGATVMDAARAAGPSEVSATFGIELAMKPGAAVAAVLADGEAKASISVTLTWQPGREPSAVPPGVPSASAAPPVPPPPGVPPAPAAPPRPQGSPGEEPLPTSGSSG